MNVSILHIVRKDFRRLKYLLALWVSIIIADFLCESGLITPNYSFGGDIHDTFAFLALLKTLAAFILVAFLVLEDNLVDTNSFWLTRPISGTRLFFAKAFFATLFVVMPPVLAESAAILLNHGTIHQAAIGSAPLLVDMLMLTVATGLLASLTSTLGQLVVVIFFLLVGSMFIGSPQNNFNAIDRWFKQFGYLFQDQNLILSAALVSDVLVVILGAIIIREQFRTRNMRTLATAAILTFLFCITINGFWSTDFLSPRPTAVVEYADGIPAIANPDGIRTVEESGYGYQPENSQKRVVGNIRFTNLKRGYQAVSRITQSSGHLSGWVDWDRLSEDAVFNATDLHALTGILRGRYLSGNWNPPLQTLAMLVSDDYKFMEDRPLRYQANIDADIFRYRRLGVLPIAPNALVEKNGNQISIHRILRNSGRLQIEISERFLTGIYDRNDATRRRGWSRVPWLAFVLRNRSTNELLLELNPENSFRINSYGIDRGVKHSEFSLNFALPRSASPAWFDDAELIVIDAVLVDRISRSVDWNLKIPGPNQPWSDESSSDSDTNN